MGWIKFFSYFTSLLKQFIVEIIETTAIEFHYNKRTSSIYMCSRCQKKKTYEQNEGRKSFLSKASIQRRKKKQQTSNIMFSAW